MYKRALALLFAVVMLLSLFAACSKTTGNTEKNQTASATKKEETTSQKTDKSAEQDGSAAIDFKGTELTIAVIEKSGSDHSNMNEKLFAKMAEEATGIHINWLPIKQEVAAEKISALLAGGDLPDAFWGFNETGLIDVTTISQNSELFYDLSEEGLLETYAPNVLADYEANHSLDEVTWPDGSIYGLLGNQLTSGKRDWAAACMMINKNWLDQLGLAIPTTADEFYKVLCAFRDNDMNGNGNPNDEIPLSFANGYWKSDFMLLANPFGIGGNPNWLPENAYKQIKDGKVIPTLETENFRKFLEFYYKLGQEGLLDLEGFSQTSDQWNAKVNGGLVGCTYHWEPTEGFVAIAPFEGIEGVTPIQTGLVNRTSASQNILVISAKGNAPAVLYWWNYLSSSTDMKLITRLGEEGILWEKDNGAIRPLTAPDGVAAGQIAVGENLSPALREDEVPTSVEPPIRDGIVDVVLDYIPTEGFPTRIPDPATVEDRSMIELELFDYVKSFIAKSVVEGIDDAAWQKHLQDLKTVQYDEWIAWWQAFVDGEI